MIFRESKHFININDRADLGDTGKMQKSNVLQNKDELNRSHFVEDLRETVMVYRKNLDPNEKKDLELRISGLIEDLNYL